MIYLLITILMLYFVHRCFDITNLYNPFIVFFLYHTFFMFMALSYQSKYDYFIVLEDSTVALIVWSYFATVIGGLIATTVMQAGGFRYFPLRVMRWEGKNASYSGIAGYAILFTGFLMASYYIVDTGGLLFLKDDMENARIEDRKGRGLLTLLSISFITFGMLITIFDRKSFLFKAFLFVISSFFLISFGNRAAMLEMCLMAFVLICMYRNVRLKIKYLAYIGLVIFSLLVLFGAIRSNAPYAVYDLFIAQFGWRPFVNMQNLQWIIDFVPSQLDYMKGESMLIEMKMFLPGSNPNFGTWLKETMRLVFDGGSITTSHLGVAYINFGYVGAILFPLFLGFFFQTLYVLFIRRPENSRFRLVFMLVLAMGLGGTLSSGLVSILIMHVLFLCFVSFCFILITYLARAVALAAGPSSLPGNTL